VLDGRGEGKKKWRRSPPRSSRAPPIPCVQELQDKNSSWWVREIRGRWSINWLGSPPGRVAKERGRKNEKRAWFGEFDRNSYEFEKCNALVQKVVMIGSEVFSSG
jgi:hypothetical protein